MREERLFYWDMLLRGEEVGLEEVRQLAAKASADAPEEEKAAWVLLLSAVELLRTGTPSQRCHLRAYLRYQISQAGGRRGRKPIDPRELEQAGLDELLSIGPINWGEALEPCREKTRGSVDYSAKQRIEARLKEMCRRWWEELFGAPPKVLMEGGE